MCRDLLDSPCVIGCAALPDAIPQGKSGAFKLSLEHKASLPNVWPVAQNHVLHVCALLVGDRALQFATHILVLEPGCIDTRAKDGRSPLHTAAWFGHCDLTSYLLDKGVNPLATTRMGFTKLEWRSMSALSVPSSFSLASIKVTTCPLVATCSNRILVPYSLSALNISQNVDHNLISTFK